jgi:hypothetical protein
VISGQLALASFCAPPVGGFLQDNLLMKVTLVFTLFTYDQIPLCVWSSVVLVSGQNPKALWLGVIPLGWKSEILHDQEDARLDPVHMYSLLA